MNPQLQQIEQKINDLIGHLNTHTHNGVGSQVVSYTNLRNKPIFPIQAWLEGTQPATAGNYSAFFTFPVGGTITGITEVHKTAGSDGSAVTLQVEKLTGTTAPGSGLNLLTSGFNLKATANTVQTGTLVTTSSTAGVPYTTFNANDRLGLVLTGTPTAVNDLVVIVTVQYN